MFAKNLIRNSFTYLMAKVPNQRWSSTIAAVNQLEAKTLQETALAENCILVDEFDRAIGQSSKRDCHRVDENGLIKLHRAFSVFLFNSNGDMLIQKRSAHKVLEFVFSVFVFHFTCNATQLYSLRNRNKFLSIFGFFVRFCLGSLLFFFFCLEHR